jgi:hypothetical protein
LVLELFYCASPFFLLWTAMVASGEGLREWCMFRSLGVIEISRSYQAMARCTAAIVGQGGRFAPREPLLRGVFLPPGHRAKMEDLRSHCGDPSGIVPNVVDSGRGLRSRLRYSGVEGPDCFFNFLFEVLFVISEGPYVTAIHVRVFFVNLPNE